MKEGERYRRTVYLEKESAEVVQDFLETNGQSFSGWMNALVIEFAKEIRGQPSALSKSIDEMTVKEFAEVASYWFKKARGQEDDSEEGPSSHKP